MSTATALAGYPFTPHRVEVGGHRMSYVDEGDPTAPPVLLVHGNPTWSFYYRSLLQALPARGRRVIAPDHIGMGLSDKPTPEDYPHTLARRVADLTAFVDGLELTEPVSLVVHDWGGPIGLAWAAEHLDRVRDVVVMNTGAFPLPADHGLPWMLQAARLPVVGDVLVRRLGAFSLGALVLGTGRAWLPPEARRGLLAPYDRPEHRVAVQAFVRDIPLGPDDPAHPVLVRLAARLPDLDARPVQVHWGMKDPVFDADILAHVEHHLPHAEVHRYPDAGHYVLEDATPAIVERVGAFLDRR
ncbi:haloalkane dehalogenase [Actinomycetospora sp. NBRC 106375]|uniref:alpha/beta fold hydrolase n=1 Tax=Actinomycetospora sp. NBRC 106375 TaxID=3032207 RepID=UPI0024A1ED58|nr:alpha/beta fold hydrolase [Actinomycetospora sp. NBRC 106375]GLZ49616.1 haloalkane dehalogenase [Actinomycetospora sp. NBRC 106375]